MTEANIDHLIGGVLFTVVVLVALILSYKIYKDQS